MEGTKKWQGTVEVILMAEEEGARINLRRQELQRTMGKKRDNRGWKK